MRWLPAEPFHNLLPYLTPSLSCVLDDFFFFFSVSLLSRMQLREMWCVAGAAHCKTQHTAASAKDIEMWLCVANAALEDSCCIILRHAG